MPKQTAFKRMSKAEQAEYLKSLHKPTPVPRKRAAAAPAGEARVKEDPGPKDGLEWLIKKKRIDRAQAAAAYRLRLGFRDDGGGVEGVVSCLEIGGGGGSSDGVQHRLAAVTDARREYLLVIGQVLWGEPQMVAVVDGVCGRGYTLRYLAGQDRHRADELEAVLKAALSLVVAWKKAHERLTNGAETVQHSTQSRKYA
jgi:hypothetical protein